MASNESAGAPASFWAGGSKRFVAVGLFCVIAALIGQCCLVYLCYDGNWTGLYFTGDVHEPPPQLAGENIYVFQNSSGYDGQFYHYVAHDPFRRRGLSRWIDVPEVRYQRILLPLGAWLLAGGSDNYIDPAYYTLVLLFVFLGGYWTSRYAAMHERHPLFGLVFLLVPSVLVSLERLTVEIALAALTAGFAVYWKRGPRWKTYLILVAAVLTRETGLFLVGAYVFWFLAAKDWRRAAGFLSSASPGLLWIGFISSAPQEMVVEVVGPSHSTGRYLGLIRRLWTPLRAAYEQLVPAERIIAQVTDEIAIVGMILACVFGVVMAIRRYPDALALTAALSGLSAVFLVGSLGFWISPVGYTRPFSSLFVVLALWAVTQRRFWFLVPLLTNDLRLVVEWGPRLMTMLGIGRG